MAASLQYSELPGADESDNKMSDTGYNTKETKLWSPNTKETERDSLIV